MNIRAKLVCTSVEKVGESEHVTLHAVTSGSEENKQWAKYTPAGALNLSIDNPSAQGVIKKGAEFYLELSPA